MLKLLDAFVKATLIMRDGRGLRLPCNQGSVQRKCRESGKQKTIFFNLMCESAKIWANILNKSVLHNARSKTSLFELHKFVLFNLMENLPFDLSHTIYINILYNMRGLGRLDDIYHVALMKKIIQDQGVYHI